MRPLFHQLSPGLRSIQSCSALAVIFLVLNSCKPSSPVGEWEGALATADSQSINFAFAWIQENGQTVWEIRNDTERIRVTEFGMEGDSMRVRMPHFDSEFICLKEGNTLKGRWIKHYSGYDRVMPFTARKRSAPESADLERQGQEPDHWSGKWAVQFLESDSTLTPAIGIFEQKGARVTGTFLTSTGDYRFLEGRSQNGELSLSCFDGSHAYLFRARAYGDQEGTDSLGGGYFWSGFEYKVPWWGVKDSMASLPDPYGLTFLKPGYSTVEIVLPDLNGDTVRLSDPMFQDKVVILQVMGSWCPNCLDESRFLADFYLDHKEQGLEIIALAFERSPELEEARYSLLRLIENVPIPYTVLFAGRTGKENTSRILPMLNHVMSYPTTIILDRQRRVRRIHTGFNGPATGVYYTRFVQDFHDFMGSLLSEGSQEVILQ